MRKRPIAPSGKLPRARGAGASISPCCYSHASLPPRGAGEAHGLVTRLVKAVHGARGAGGPGSPLFIHAHPV